MDDTDIEKLVKGFFGLLFGITNFVLEPFIAVWIWLWFLVPWGLPALTWPAAFGANLVLNVFIGPPHKNYKDDEATVRMGSTLIFNLAALTIAFVVHVVLAVL